MTLPESMRGRIHDRSGLCQNRLSGGPFVIEIAAIALPGADEVLVRVVATGMCHTDMVARDRIYLVPQPIVLGHEGAGVVKAAAAIVGASKPGAALDLDANDLMQSVKSIRRVVEGDSVPDVFILRLIDLHPVGRFPFDRLVRFYPLDQINEAAADSEKGGTLKPIIRIGEPQVGPPCWCRVGEHLPKWKQ